MDHTICVKSSVRFKNFNRYTLEFLTELLSCAERFGRSYTITSANDGNHSADSYHFRDTAWDVRMNDIEPAHRYAIRDVLDRELPPYYDVVLEEFPDNPSNDHLHIEADLSKVADYFLFDHSEGDA